MSVDELKRRIWNNTYGVPGLYGLASLIEGVEAAVEKLEAELSEPLEHLTTEVVGATPAIVLLETDDRERWIAEVAAIYAGLSNLVSDYSTRLDEIQMTMAANYPKVSSAARRRATRD